MSLWKPLTNLITGKKGDTYGLIIHELKNRGRLPMEEAIINAKRRKLRLIKNKSKNRRLN